MNTKFGFSQIISETPKWATWVFRITLYLCAITVLFVTTYNFPAHTVKLVAQFCSATTIFVHSLTRMFGLTISNDPTQQDGSAQK